MSSTVEKIKENLDVATVLSSYLKLEKAGANFKAKCPFHNEKTPSFFISPNRGTYYCFGCGAKGDIFTFVQEFEGLDFYGALKVLAEKAGVPLEVENRKDKGERERIFECLSKATMFFVMNLSKSNEAQDYLDHRGIKKETIENWSIGWAPDDWRSLSSYLKGEGFTETEMMSAGLIKKSPDGKVSEPYDVFRARIMFPIFDGSGRTIGFSGRILKDTPNAPKYLNSPDTPLFHKSEVLYGLHKAKGAIRQQDYSILVEGQMDLLTCHQEGFSNAVATSGTAFTVEHLERLKKISGRILMAFDSDNAGLNAALRSAELALRLGMEVKIASLPTGTDPADLIIKDLDSWKQTLKTSKHLIDFYLEKTIDATADKRNLAKEVQKKILPLVAILESSIEQAHFISVIAKKIGVKEDAVWSDLSKISKNPAGASDREEIKTKEEKKRRNYIEKRIIGIIMWQDSLDQPTIDKKIILESIERIVGVEYVKKIFDEANYFKDEIIFEAEANYKDTEKLQDEVNELLENFEEDFTREEFTQAMLDLQRAESSGDTNEVQNLLKKCQEISEKLSKLSKNKLDIKKQIL